MPYKDYAVSRSYSNAKNKEWYIRNRDSKRAKTKERLDKLKQWYSELKSKLRCEECGENHIACLDFHHKNPDDKENSVSLLMANGVGKVKILEEIDKCIVLCSNCHRKLHFNIERESMVAESEVVEPSVCETEY